MGYSLRQPIIKNSPCMPSLFFRYSSAAALLVLFCLWTYFSAPSQPEPVKASRSVAETWAPTLSGSYLAARHATLEADSREASLYLSQALSHAPQDKELAGQAVRSLLMSGDLEGAVKLAREKKAMDVKSPLIHLSLFADEARQGNWELAEDHLKNIRAYGLQAVTLPFLQSWVTLASDGKVELPSKTLNLSQTFYQAFLNYQNALLYDLAGDAKQAAIHYDLMLDDIAQTPERFVNAAIQFHLRNGDRSRAEEIYSAFNEATAGNLTSQAIPPEAALDALSGQEPMVRTPQEGLAEVMFTMASMLHGEMVEREGLVYARLALALRPDFSDAHYLIATIYESMQKPKEALDAFAAIPGNDPLFRRAALRRAFLLDESGHTQEAVTMLKQLAKKQPHPSDIYVTLGDILRNQQKYKEAASYYTLAIDELGTVKPQHWPLFYTRGISYERAGDWEKAETDLLRALSMEPEQADVKNYLAYSWLLMGKNVSKATEMLEQAVASRPEDGHILDSLAWAYFLSGNHEKAIETIERAVEMMPHDPTVNDHYGDILWHRGRRTEARYQWERALAFHPEPKDKVAIERKLASGLPVTPGRKNTSTASSGAMMTTHP